MPDPTPNHGYQRPDEGQTDWDNPLNENATQLDIDIEVRDAETNIGDYQPHSGAKFIATDTGRVFMGDGTSWTHFGEIPFLSEVRDVEGNLGAYEPLNNRKFLAIDTARVFLGDGSTWNVLGRLVIATDPVADFGWTPTSPSAGEEVTFDATPSSDPDGSIIAYDWDFGDGATGSGLTVTHTYSAADSYPVTLTVTDDDGNTDTATKTITVGSGTAAVIDDYEAADPLASYSGTLLTDRWEVQTAVALEGTQTLHFIGTDGNAGYDPGIAGRGHRYRALVQAQTSLAGNIWFVLLAQDSAALLDNGYGFVVDWGAQDIHLSKRSTTSGNQELGLTDVTLDLSTTYVAEVDLLAQGVSPNLIFRLLDTNDTLLATVEATHDEHIGGTFGWHGGGSVDGYMDLVTEEAL